MSKKSSFPLFFKIFFKKFDLSEFRAYRIRIGQSFVPVSSESGRQFRLVFVGTVTNRWFDSVKPRPLVFSPRSWKGRTIQKSRLEINIQRKPIHFLSWTAIKKSFSHFDRLNANPGSSSRWKIYGLEIKIQNYTLFWFHARKSSLPTTRRVEINAKSVSSSKPQVTRSFEKLRIQKNVQISSFVIKFFSLIINNLIMTLIITE